MCDFSVEQKYTLITETNCNKSVLFVKLTDSALHSIDCLLRSKGDSSVKLPTIQFIDNNGTITFPINDQNINYGFTLSNVEPDGSSFQCLQHTEKRTLKSLGPMHKKMQIHANEDSYAKTKCKMAAVEQEQKSFCTKEIKTTNGSLISHKKKIQHLGSVYPTKVSTLSKKSNESAFLKPKVSNLALKEPIRKRIIHILAIKPYKKPDVLLKLIKEGINEDDKKSVPYVLEQVGSLKGDMYTLSSHLRNEVEDNWKFYTSEELKLIQRKKPYLLSNNFVLPKPDSQNLKDVDNIPAFKEPQNKKLRISHFNNHKVPEQTIKAGFSECNAPRMLKQTRVENQQKITSSKQINGVSNGVNKANGKSLSHFKFNKINNRKCNETCLWPISTSQEPFSKRQMHNLNHPENIKM